MKRPLRKTESQTREGASRRAAVQTGGSDGGQKRDAEGEGQAGGTGGLGLASPALPACSSQLTVPSPSIWDLTSANLPDSPELLASSCSATNSLAPWTDLPTHLSLVDWANTASQLPRELRSLPSVCGSPPELDYSPLCTPLAGTASGPWLVAGDLPADFGWGRE